MKWTAEMWGSPDNNPVTYRVLNDAGRFVAYIDVEPDEEGRLTVARMVAALQMQNVLTRWDDYVAGRSETPDMPALIAEMRAALEAAKRLP